MKTFIHSFFDFIYSAEGLTREDLINELQEDGVDLDALEKQTLETVNGFLETLRKKSGKMAKKGE